MQPLHTVASAKTSHHHHGIGRVGAFFANPDEFLHGFHLLVPSAEVALANGFPHELRDSSLPTPRTGVKGIPEVVVEV
jgi:hypothetical protein